MVKKALKETAKPQSKDATDHSTIERDVAAANAAPSAANAAPKSKPMTDAEYTSRIKFTIIGA